MNVMHEQQLVIIGLLEVLIYLPGLDRVIYVSFPILT
jgi:hypothetical protein